MEDITWLKALNRNLINNRQLQFVSMMTFSSVNSQGLPESDLLNLRKTDEEKACMLFDIDIRSNFAQAIKDSKTGVVCINFPLSRHKMKFTGNFEIFLENENQRKSIWEEKLTEEEKKMYKEADPDQEKQQKDAINKFNTPEVSNISSNFAIIAFYPKKGKKYFSINFNFLVEQTISPMPQVVADSRHGNFESEFKPYKKLQKFIHTEEEGKGWTIKEVNPW